MARSATAPICWPPSAALRPELIGPEPQSLFYSGGTTGTPKLVRHGQGFYQTLLAIAACYCATGEPPMRFLSGSSFTHVSGQMPAFLTLFEGGTLFVGHNSSAAEFLSTVERERIRSTFLTPALLYAVIDHPLTAATDTSSLRYLNVGGAAASPAPACCGDRLLRPGGAPGVRVKRGAADHRSAVPRP